MKFFKFLFSGTLMGILLIIFAIAIGYATLIENDFDATTAKMLIYNARWFEFLMLVMIVNFTGMIFTRQLYRKSKLNILVIHVSLVIIIIGAAITRYLGFEGQMHIRQGQTTDRYLSAETYFNIHLEAGLDKKDISKRIWLTPIRRKLLRERFEFKNNSYELSIERYMPNAIETLVPDDQGVPMINLVTAGPKGRKDASLRYGESKTLNGIGISFGDTTLRNNVQLLIRNGELFMRTPEPNTSVSAQNDSSSTKEFIPVVPMQVYQFKSLNLMVKDFVEKARFEYLPVQGEEPQGVRVIKLRIYEDEDRKEVYVKWGEWEQLLINGVKLSFKFGYQTWALPFSLRLNEFQLERYPGSMSPSSFASEITLIDEENNVEKPYRIFMNNILEYRGYRFYQSSYDTDEKGTILSVNHDYWGTMVTYFGYFLLFGSLIVSFFTRKTRFRRVSQQIKEVHEQRKKLLVSLLIILLAFAGVHQVHARNTHPNRTHAASFGKLLLQNRDGRIIPLNTISNQVLVKVHKRSKFQNLTADQVFLGMVSNPQYWQNQPMIKVGDPALQNMLGIQGKYAAYQDFFDEKGQYKLKAVVDEAYAKKPALRNMFDKELIYVDERVNVCYMVYNGSFLKLFPIPNHPNNKWMSPFDHPKNGDSNAVKASAIFFTDYLDKLQTGIQTGNYAEANMALQAISTYQKKEGAEIIPSERKTNLEVLYNDVNIFKTLFPIYMLLGMILFGFFFIQIFKPVLEFKWIIRILVGILVTAFAAQTLGIALRWYISGHAPWSNGYESMIYISWATMLAGFIFMKKSPIILSVTSLLTGVTLLTAHMSWMNPEITNLVPVLKSYWLTIHVATITASYGFLALGSLTGFLNLCIMMFRNKNNSQRINLTLRELSLIIELSLTVGLVLLVIGNFLGGIWANESWGRYWGWDPKETWSLVTIIVYSFILHMRLVPGLRNTFSFNFLAMFGFSSVLMTYFGVNYYLSGLHSYASGDPVPIPTFVYYTLFIMVTISVFAAYNNFKLKDQTSALESEEP